MYYKFKSTLIKTGTYLHTYGNRLLTNALPQNVGPKMFKNVLKQIQNYKNRKMFLKVLFNKEFITLSMNLLDANSNIALQSRSCCV